MKKIIMVLAFICLAKVAFGQSIEASYGHIIGSVKGSNIYTTSFKIGLPFEYKEFALEPYLGQKTWAEYGSNLSNGYPFRETYEMGIKLSWKDLLYVDVNHYCTHDVVNGYNYDTSNGQLTTAREDNKWTKERWDYMLTTVTVGFKYKYYSVKFD